MRLTGSRRTLPILVFAVLCSTASVAQAQNFSVCHGYSCTFQTKVFLTGADRVRIASIMAGGRGSAEAERSAVRRAVQVFERRSTQVIGVTDRPKMDFGKGRQRGQMDCVDKSTNTDHFLRYLQSAGLLRFHSVGRRDARGSFLDGRYPHFTAVSARPFGYAVGCRLLVRAGRRTTGCDAFGRMEGAGVRGRALAKPRNNNTHRGRRCGGCRFVKTGWEEECQSLIAGASGGG